MAHWIARQLIGVLGCSLVCFSAVFWLGKVAYEVKSQYNRLSWAEVKILSYCSLAVVIAIPFLLQWQIMIAIAAVTALAMRHVKHEAQERRMREQPGFRQTIEDRIPVDLWPWCLVGFGFWVILAVVGLTTKWYPEREESIYTWINVWVFLIPISAVSVFSVISAVQLLRSRLDRIIEELESRIKEFEAGGFDHRANFIIRMTEASSDGIIPVTQMGYESRKGLERRVSRLKCIRFYLGSRFLKYRT